MSFNYNLREGDIIWAKVKGHQWWPARLVEIIRQNVNQEGSARVEFIGDNARASVPLSRIKDYQDYYVKYSKTKRKGVLKAISAANILLSQIHNPSSDRKLETSTTATKRPYSEGVYTIEEARSVLVESIKKENISFAIAYSKRIMEAIKIIRDNTHDHYTIHKTNIGAILQKFIYNYHYEPYLKPIVKEANQTLKVLKDIVIDAYFGKTSYDVMGNSDPKMINGDKVNLQRRLSGATEVRNSPKSSRLTISVCQELAKSVEDVFFD